MESLPSLTPVTFDRSCSWGEWTLATLSKYFHLTGPMGHISQGYEVRFVENEAPSWVVFALKIASYFLFFPIALFLFVTRLILGCQYQFTIQREGSLVIPPNTDFATYVGQLFSTDQITSMGAKDLYDLLSVIKTKKPLVNLLEKKTSDGKTLFDLLMAREEECAVGSPGSPWLKCEEDLRNLRLLLEIEPRFLETPKGAERPLMRAIRTKCYPAAKEIGAAMLKDGKQRTPQEEVFIDVIFQKEVSPDTWEKLTQQEQHLAYDLTQIYYPNHGQ